MAEVEMLKVRTKPVREKTPPRCPSPTKRARGNAIFLLSTLDHSTAESL